MKKNNVHFSIKPWLFVLIFASPIQFLAQWKNMSRFSCFGLVNYYAKVDVKNAKRIFEEVLSMNAVFKNRNIEYNKSANICVNEYMVDPLNANYVYVIHAIKVDQGRAVNLFFYYIENRLRFFYEIDEGDKRVTLQWDPAFLDDKKDKKNKKWYD